MKTNLKQLAIIFSTLSSIIVQATAEPHYRHLHRRQAASSSSAQFPVIGPGTTSKLRQQCTKREISVATGSKSPTSAEATSAATGAPHLLTASVLCKLQYCPTLHSEVVFIAGTRLISLLASGLTTLVAVSEAAPTGGASALGFDLSSAATSTRSSKPISPIHDGSWARSLHNRLC